MFFNKLTNLFKKKKAQGRLSDIRLKTKMYFLIIVFLKALEFCKIVTSLGQYLNKNKQKD